jgi:hypothetical protein
MTTVRALNDICQVLYAGTGMSTIIQTHDIHQQYDSQAQLHLMYKI